MSKDMVQDTSEMVAEATVETAGTSLAEEHASIVATQPLQVLDSPVDAWSAGAVLTEQGQRGNAAKEESPELGGSSDTHADAEGDSEGTASDRGADAGVAELHQDEDQAEDGAGVGDDAGGVDARVGAAPDTGAEGTEAESESAIGGDVAEVVSPAALVATLVATATPRQNRRRSSRDAQDTAEHAPEVDAIAAAQQDGTASAWEESPQPEERIRLLDLLDTALAEEEDTRLWREQWPMNEVRMVGRLLARSSDAPALDGVQRTRMELALVEQHGDEFGSMGTLPIFVMPGAPGFTAIAAEIRRARREKRRLAPIMVEVQGILRQLPDRDGRYATERYRVLMGVEVHRITPLADDAEQFAYWRGRATVTASRRYEYRGIPYQRVTAVVELKQRKPRLRGTSITHLPVDFLVAPAHDHADRFEHIGQRLLIEATIAPETQRMHDNHPDLVGIDDPRRKAQLQVLRESVVSVTMGEFPDEAAEHAYAAWVTAGRPRPERRGRMPRSAALAQAVPGTPQATGHGRAAEVRRDRQQPSSARAGEQKRVTRS